VSPAAQAVRTLRQSYDNASGSRRKTRTLANGSNPRKPLILRVNRAISSVSLEREVWRFFSFACKGSGVRVPPSPPSTKTTARNGGRSLFLHVLLSAGKFPTLSSKGSGILKSKGSTQGLDSAVKMFQSSPKFAVNSIRPKVGGYAAFVRSFTAFRSADHSW